jgi:hypothetical protein
MDHIEAVWTKVEELRCRGDHRSFAVISYTNLDLQLQYLLFHESEAPLHVDSNSYAYCTRRRYGCLGRSELLKLEDATISVPVALRAQFADTKSLKALAKAIDDKRRSRGTSYAVLDELPSSGLHGLARRGKVNLKPATTSQGP